MRQIYNPLTDQFNLILTLGNIVTVENVGSFPNAVDGVITLQPNTSYYLTGHIDLLGARLVCSGITAIVGLSSETCSLTSTGLGIGVPLITANDTLSLQELSIKDVDTAVLIEGDSSTALDWIGVNFLNVPNIGLVDTSSNFIYIRGAFLNSKGLVFGGTIGTIGFSDSLLVGDGLDGNIITLQDTATINARIRFNDCSIVAFGLTKALNISNLATIPVESFILNNINFSGGGVYLASLNFDDNKSLFRESKGITNTARIANYFMSGNTVQTVITAIGVAVKVAGITTLNTDITQKFTHTNNRVTYTGGISEFFQVSLQASLVSGANNVLGIYVAVNGILIPESEMYATANGGGRAESVGAQTIVLLQPNDYIEIWVENESTVNNIRAEYLNVIVKGLS